MSVVIRGLRLSDKERLFRGLLAKSTVVDGHKLFNGSLTLYGYGQLRVAGKLYATHRLSAYISGKLDDINDSSKCVLHIDSLCRHRNCWEDSHLYIGTQSDNMYDRVKSGNHFQVQKLYCKSGHEFTPENTSYRKVITKRGITYSRECKACKRQDGINRRKG